MVWTLDLACRTAQRKVWMNVEKTVGKKVTLNNECDNLFNRYALMKSAIEIVNAVANNAMSWMKSRKRVMEWERERVS